MSQLPDIKSQFPEWYQEVIYKAELADQSPVRGTMIIRPYGWSIWENITKTLDKRIKETGHQNASFPLFIPESFIKKEAQHVEGFAPELAVVTHAGGKELEEPLVVRPTSETIIHYMFAKWITSWRDLPLKINQWCNVVRWEMRPRPFLRTTEFFWQEGHTAHETRDEAYEEVMLMLNEYVKLAQDYLAIPVIAGRKTDSERFPGAEITMTFEAVMQDGKALQMGTSHLLSRTFAKAFNMTFQDRNKQQEYPYLTSWGVTTRLIGALVMTHGDQAGLIMPPRVAPIQVVIIPIFTKDTDNQTILDAAYTIEKQLTAQDIRCHVDARDYKTPGAKFYEWEIKGVPLRIELGPRDLKQGLVMVVQRVDGNKTTIGLDNIAQKIPTTLEAIHHAMFNKAKNRLNTLWHKANKLAQFGPTLAEHNGLYQTGWCGDPTCEQQLKEYKAFTRCLIDEKTFTECFYCTRPSNGDVLVAKAY